MNDSIQNPPTESATTSPDTDNTKGQDGMKPGDRAAARTQALVEFRAGDGPLIAIEPEQDLQLERAEMSMVVSWKQDGQPMNTAIPLVEFNQFLETGKIEVRR